MLSEIALAPGKELDTVRYSGEILSGRAAERKIE
jgi:hypothetical protein